MTNISIQRIVSVQFFTSLVIAAVSLIVNTQAAISVLLGGMSVALPAAYMAWRLRTGSVVPELAMAQLLAAELGKLLITGLMIGAVFIWVESLLFGFFFFGLIATYGCGLVAALVQATRLQAGISSETSVTSGTKLRN
ncbi:MAG: ATP synthase subunit I [Pseudomonadales bacterium]